MQNTLSDSNVASCPKLNNKFKSRAHHGAVTRSAQHACVELRTSTREITSRPVDDGSARDLHDAAGPPASDAQLTGLVTVAHSPDARAQPAERIEFEFNGRDGEQRSCVRAQRWDTHGREDHLPEAWLGSRVRCGGGSSDRSDRRLPAEPNRSPWSAAPIATSGLADAPTWAPGFRRAGLGRSMNSGVTDVGVWLCGELTSSPPEDGGS